MADTQLLLQQGFAHHQAGRWQEARNAYMAVIQKDPRSPDAHHLMGLLEHQQGRRQESLPWLEKAVALAPRQAQFLANYGEILRTLGQMAQARKILEKAVQIQADYLHAWQNLASVYLASGEYSAAQRALEKALSLDSARPETWNAFGLLWNLQGNYAKAKEALAKALELRADYPDAQLHMAHALCHLGDHGEAVKCCHAVITQHPDLPRAWFQAAMSWMETDQVADALEGLKKALELDPTFADAWNNLGLALEALDRPAEADEAFAQALTLDPKLTSAINNRANFLRQLGRLTEARELLAPALKPGTPSTLTTLAAIEYDLGNLDASLEATRQALALDPTFAQGHMTRSFALLLQGRFKEGWQEHEWRWEVPELKRKARQMEMPFWRGLGEPLAGRSIFMRAEGGFGDLFHLVRYVPLLRELGAQVILETPEECRELFWDSFAAEVTYYVAGEPLPQAHWQVGIFSLPRIFGHEIETLPSHVPYLRVQEQKRQAWAELLGAKKAALRVGLVWAGNARHRNDRHRSMSLTTLAPLGQVTGVEWVSLQVGSATSQLGSSPWAIRDLSVNLVNFAETAGALENLDLLVSVDTSAGHLAGALGRQVWTIIPSNPDWRWLQNTRRSPWYPTMELFRQKRPGDWLETIEELCFRLNQKAASMVNERS